MNKCCSISFIHSHCNLHFMLQCHHSAFLLTWQQAPHQPAHRCPPSSTAPPQTWSQHWVFGPAAPHTGRDLQDMDGDMLGKFRIKRNYNVKRDKKIITGRVCLPSLMHPSTRHLHRNKLLRKIHLSYKLCRKKISSTLICIIYFHASAGFSSGFLSNVSIKWMIHKEQ